MTEGPTLIVMAAGAGSRYGGLKQIEPVGPGGEFIIEYSLYDAIKAGFRKIVFVIRKEIEAVFRERIGRRIEPLIDTRYVSQSIEDVPPGFSAPPGREKPWGTGHAVWSSRHAVDSPFAVINADDYYGASSFRVLSGFLKQVGERNDTGQYCMVGFQLENTLTENGYVARGVCSIDEEGYLQGICERTKIRRFSEAVKYTEDGVGSFTIPSASIISMNAWGFTPGFFRELEDGFSKFLSADPESVLHAEYYLPSAVGSLIADKKARVKVLMSGERWYGMTYQEDKPTVKQAISSLVGLGKYPEVLWPE